MTFSAERLQQAADTTDVPDIKAMFQQAADQAGAIEALRGLMNAVSGATEPYDDCADCAACANDAEHPEDACALHRSEALWEAFMAAEEALGPCRCGHARRDHHDEESTACRTCRHCLAFKHPDQVVRS